MNITRRLAFSFLALALLVGLALPSFVTAQTDQNSNSSGGGWFRDVLNQLTTPRNTTPAPSSGGQSNSGGITDNLLNQWLNNTSAPSGSGTQNQSGLSRFLQNLFSNNGNSTSNTALDQGGNAVNGFLNILTNFGHSPVGQFFSDLFAPGVDATRGVVDTVINGAVGAGIDVSNWVFRSNTTNPGTPVNNGDLSIPSLPSGMTNVTTTYDSAGNPIYHVTTYDAQGYAIGTVSYDSRGNPIETVIYDNEGNPVTVPNAARPSGSGPSIPGASKGTVGNPFSDGTDKNDEPSSNKEDTSNPYLFEYDPNSTNNNPSGSGAMEQ